MTLQFSSTLNKCRSISADFYQQAAINTLSNMLVPLAGLCDTAFLGHLQDLKYFAGVILGSILFDYLYRTLKFLRSSTTALTAQASGKNNGEEVLLAFLRSGLIALIISLLILCLQYPIQKLGFTVLSGAKEVELSGVDYFNTRIWGTPAVLLNFVLIGWFLGKTKQGKKWVLLISFVANASNVLLDYLMISRWGWASWGAGLATSIGQYIALLVGLIGVYVSINKQDLFNALPKVISRQSFKEILRLNNDIFVRFLLLISSYSIFTNFSATIGTDSLAQNGLLIQIALLSQFTIQGTGLAAQALIGKSQGEDDKSKFTPLIVLAVLTSLPIALSFALSTQFFPDTIFGLFGDHQQLNQGITQYTFWLLPLLSFTALTFMFEAYFIALKQGSVLRNSSLISFFGIFLPFAVVARYLQSVHLLWLSLCLYMLCNSLYLGYKLVGQQRKFYYSSLLEDSEDIEIPTNILPNLLYKKSGTELIKSVEATDLIELRTRAVFGNPTKRRKKSFLLSTLRFFSSILLGILLFSSFSFYLGRSFANQKHEMSQIETLAVVTSNSLSEFIGNQYVQVQEMTVSPFLSDTSLWQAWSNDRKREYFQNNFLANSEGMDSYAIIDAYTGDTVFSGGTGTKTKNYKYIDYFQQAVKQRKPVIIPFRKSTKTGIPYLYIAAPSFDDLGNLLFVVRCRVTFEEIKDKIATDVRELNLLSNSPQSLEFFLVDKIGRVIATNDSQKLKAHINQFFEISHELRKGKLSTAKIEEVDSSTYLVAYSPVAEPRGLTKLDWSFVLVKKEGRLSNLI